MWTFYLCHISIAERCNEACSLGKTSADLARIRCFGTFIYGEQCGNLSHILAKIKFIQFIHLLEKFEKKKATVEEEGEY